MQKLFMRSRLSALVIMSVVMVGVFAAPMPANAAIICYVGTTRDLEVGVEDGEDIRNLQKVLNNDPDTQVAITGSGSPGNEIIRFGPATRRAVKDFQRKYNITPVLGYVGTITRAKLTELYGCGGGMTAYDYNGDGVADKLDEFFLRDLILENKTCPAGTVCDVNNDEQINVADVLTLVAYLNANGPTITVTTPVVAVETGSAYHIRWTTTPRPIKSGVNSRILKNGAVVANQQFGRPSNFGTTFTTTQGTFASSVLDYTDDGIVDKNDIYFLRDVVQGDRTCPASKVCDLNGGGTNIDDVIALTNLVFQYTALPDTGSFVWNVPADLMRGNDYKIQVTAENDAGVSGMSEPFWIVAPAPRPPATLTIKKNGIGTVKSTDAAGNIIGDVDCGAGDATCSHTYAMGQPVYLKAIPESGHRFVSWANCFPTDNPQCMRLLAAGTVNVTATFEPIPQPPATLRVNTPTSCIQGNVCTISWTASEGGLWDITIKKGTVTVIASWLDLTEANSFDWSVPANLALGDDYKVIVAFSEKPVEGSRLFSVVPQPKIQVTAPNSGTEEWNIGSLTSPKNITWTSTGLVGNSVNITLKRQPGNIVVGSLTPMGTLNNQGNNINPQSNTLAWRLDNSFLKDPSFQQFGSGYVIEICNATHTVCDESDNPFTILDEIPKVVFTADPTLTPQSPYTIGESVVFYKALLQNNGIRQLTGLTLMAKIQQGGARSAVIELPLACRTQVQGTMTLESCLSDGASQLLPVRAEIGQFKRGQGSAVLEVKQGTNILATKSITVQLYPSPSVQVLFPQGPASVNRFTLRKPLPQPIRWKTEGLIDNVLIKIKQADPVPLYDFNNDGAVNGQDVIILRDFALSGGLSVCNTTTAKNCDIDGDGALTESDAGWLTSNILLVDPLRYVDRVEMFDFNGDQVFSGLDRIALAQAIADSSSLSDCFAQTGKNCDVNRDGAYNINDGEYLNSIVSASPPATTLPGASMLTNNKDAENSFLWTPDAPFVLPAGNYKIVVCDISRPKVCDESDNTFLIYAGPPTITKPAVNEKFFIQDDMKIEVFATHALSLSEYKIGLYQNHQLIYENVRSVPFIINSSLMLPDGKRVIDVLKEGPLRVVVSGKLGGGKGFTNSAERIVQLEFNRTPPVFQSPTPAEGQEVNLGKFPIPVAAIHGAKPRRYELILFQNGANVFRQTINAQSDGKFVFEFARDTLQQPGQPAGVNNRKVFDLLQEGEVKIVLQGQLLDGSFTSPAERFIRVVPVPPNFDLNGDGDIDIEDFKILQLTILDERKCTDPPVTADKNCDLNRDGAVNVADLAAMVAHPLYQKPQPAPSLPAVGAPVTVPTVSSPQSGAAWSPSNPVVIQEVARATGYLVGFIRDRQLIHENYRDESRSLATTAGAGGTRVYQVSAAARSKFTSGLMYIYVRALVNNQWTDAAIIPVTVR